MVRWTRRGDGAHRITLRVEHHLTTDEVARVLAFAETRYGLDVESATVAELREEVRYHLHDTGAGCIVDIEADVAHGVAAERAFGRPS